MNNIVLKLYVTGHTLRSLNAVANLCLICEHELNGAYQLTIIDVLDYPHLAESEKIMATPTLIREIPAPYRRIIGDLTDPEKVLQGLGLHRAIQGDLR